MEKPLLRPVPVEELGRERGWDRPGTRLCLSGLSVVLAKDHVDADVDDDEEEEEEEERRRSKLD